MGFWTVSGRVVSHCQIRKSWKLLSSSLLFLLFFPFLFSFVAIQLTHIHAWGMSTDESGTQPWSLRLATKTPPSPQSVSCQVTVLSADLRGACSQDPRCVFSGSGWARAVSRWEQEVLEQAGWSARVQPGRSPKAAEADRHLGPRSKGSRRCCRQKQTAQSPTDPSQVPCECRHFAASWENSRLQLVSLENQEKKKKAIF